MKKNNMQNFLHILTRPDNIPIAAMIPLFILALLCAWRQQKRKEEEAEEKVHTWPYLTRVEFLAAILVMVILGVWSIMIDAPLEQAANPMVTPNPAKAPWYFLGLQELLVYYDPWIAGVIIPSLIIIGLAAIPYLDVNEKGAGRFTLRGRPFAVTVFLLGFLGLGLGLIVFGVFFRGPGWNFFWPWQYWDPNKAVAMDNIDLPEALGARSRAAIFTIGAVLVFGWYSLGIPFYLVFRKRPFMQKLGWFRYGIIAFLLLAMTAVPIKIVLRHLFNIKYIWVTPWFNF
jgi:hypothetical protein